MKNGQHPLTILKKYPKITIALVLFEGLLLYTYYRVSQYAKQIPKTIEGYSSVEEWLTSGFEDKPTYITDKLNIFSQNYTPDKHLQADNASETTARVNLFFPKQLYQGFFSTTCIAHSLATIKALIEDHPIRVQDLEHAKTILTTLPKALYGTPTNIVDDALLKMSYQKDPSAHIFFSSTRTQPIFVCDVTKNLDLEILFLKNKLISSPSQPREIIILYLSGALFLNVGHAMVIRAIYKDGQLNLYCLDSAHFLTFFEKTSYNDLELMKKLESFSLFSEIASLGNNVLLPLFENTKA